MRLILEDDNGRMLAAWEDGEELTPLLEMYHGHLNTWMDRFYGPRAVRAIVADYLRAEGWI